MGVFKNIKQGLWQEDFLKKPGTDFFKTFAPVSGLKTIKSVYYSKPTALEMKTNKIKEITETIVVLNEDIYVEQTQGFLVKGEEDKGDKSKLLEHVTVKLINSSPQNGLK